MSIPEFPLHPALDYMRHAGYYKGNLSKSKETKGKFKY